MKIWLAAGVVCVAMAGGAAAAPPLAPAPVFPRYEEPAEA